jgi:inosose dehydratase
VDLCFDTGHHAFWDQDALAYMERVFDRIAYMHLKNVDAAVRARVTRRGNSRRRMPTRAGIMCPLPDGVVDIRARPGLLEARGFDGPVVVEQDVAEERDAESPLELATAQPRLSCRGSRDGGAGRPHRPRRSGAAHAPAASRG